MSKNNVYEVDLSLGFKTFRVNFKEFDEPVDILFNPADSDLPKRLFEAEKRIKEETKEIKDFELDENGLPNTDDYIDKANELNRIVYSAIDYAFGNSISEKIFKYCSPFAITDGKIFVMQFLEKITPVMKEIIEKENKSAQKKSNDYLKKYMKK